jgi:transcriptional regulator with XRE-family HTH domain
MEIGTRIRKVRELKGLSQENISLELGMSVTGYGKIERNEVSVNFDKLTKISEILGVELENIIGFDENVAFNNFNSKIDQQIGRYVMPIEMKKLYEENIKLLKEKIIYLETELQKCQNK